MAAEQVCVYCRRRPGDPKWRPFCSERCRVLDLAAWADGTYRIPGSPLPDPEGPLTPPGDDDDR